MRCQECLLTDLARTRRHPAPVTESVITERSANFEIGQTCTELMTRIKPRATGQKESTSLSEGFNHIKAPIHKRTGFRVTAAYPD